jgi:uncharacterized protein
MIARLHPVLLVLLVLPAACKQPDAAPADAMPGEFNKRALLTAFADCAVSQYQEFELSAAALETAAGAHAAAPTPDTAAALQQAWRDAMVSWERAELYQFGPAAYSNLPGGADLRDEIYAWPLFSRCKIDEQLVSKAYEGAAFADTLVNTRGLAALEYLAFYTGSDNGCLSFSPINSSGSWAALGADELAARKAAYAAAVATDVHAQAIALIAAWDPAGGNFRAQLIEAGSGSTTFTSAQAGLNAVSDALFYLDKTVKDAKVAVPLGLLVCTTERCPAALESQWAHVSAAHVTANIDGFDRLLTGCTPDGLGFDDWLRAAGAGDLADRLAVATAEARAAAMAIEPSFEDALAGDAAGVVLLHAKLKAITDLLKTEMMTVLNLELPMSLETDND